MSAVSSEGDSAPGGVGQVGADRLRHRIPEAVALEHGDRVGDRGRVGNGRVGDRVERVAGDVGDGEVEIVAPRHRHRQTAALEAETCLRTLFTSAIDAPLAAAGGGGRACARGSTPVGGRLASAELPPVKQAITRSRSAGPCRPASSSRRAAVDAVGRGQRMVGLEHLDPVEAAALAAADDDRPAVEAVAEDPLERDGDAQAGLAGAEHHHAAGRRSGGGRRRLISTAPSNASRRSTASAGSQASRPASRTSSTAVRRLGKAQRRAGLSRLRDRGSRRACRHAATRGERTTRPAGVDARWRRAPRRSGSAGCTSRSARRGPGRRS